MQVHSTVRQRWLAGEEEVRGAMEEVASLAAAGREALLKQDYTALASLMNRNFDLRRCVPIVLYVYYCSTVLWNVCNCPKP